MATGAGCGSGLVDANGVEISSRFTRLQTMFDALVLPRNTSSRGGRATGRGAFAVNRSILDVLVRMRPGVEKTKSVAVT